MTNLESRQDYFELSSKLQRRHYERTVHIKFEFYSFREILF